MNDNKSAYNASIYDENIVNVLPYYTEYHGQVIDLVKSMDTEKPKWLDTGCGTGTLALRAMAAIPGAEFTLCDPSDKMLAEAKTKFAEAKNKLAEAQTKLAEAKTKLANQDIRFLQMSSGELPFENEFDVVTAIQCHHYYQPEEREHAVRRCYEALKESGIFITFENIRMSTDESEAFALKRWSRFLAQHGNTPEDIQMQMDRRGTEVFPITIEQHLELLKKCGFRSVNLLWASYLQAGFWAVK